MSGTVDAIERCAYCRNYVPVTRIELEITEDDAYVRASVDVCESCSENHR